MLIQGYQDYWPAQFQQISAILQAAMMPNDIRIEHIGSTAVPGLAAKPIIDIDIVLEGSIHFVDIKSSLETIGYFHNGDQGIQDREVFKRRSSELHPILDQIPHHLYVCPVTSQELKRHLLFRDYLRKNTKARDQYQQLKFKIAQFALQDRKRYAQLKEQMARSMIESFLTLAEEK
ncbi:MAG: GrpB family protein [Saprospiraceae bacterium]